MSRNHDRSSWGDFCLDAMLHSESEVPWMEATKHPVDVTNIQKVDPLSVEDKSMLSSSPIHLSILEECADEPLMDSSSNEVTTHKVPRPACTFASPLLFSESESVDNSQDCDISQHMQECHEKPVALPKGLGISQLQEDVENVNSSSSRVTESTSHAHISQKKSTISYDKESLSSDLETNVFNNRLRGEQDESRLKLKDINDNVTPGVSKNEVSPQIVKEVCTDVKTENDKPDECYSHSTFTTSSFGGDIPSLHNLLRTYNRFQDNNVHEELQVSQHAKSEVKSPINDQKCFHHNETPKTQADKMLDFLPKELSPLVGQAQQNFDLIDKCLLSRLEPVIQNILPSSVNRDKFINSDSTSRKYNPERSTCGSDRKRGKLYDGSPNTIASERSGLSQRKQSKIKSDQGTAALGISETIKSEMVDERSGYNRRKRSKIKSDQGTEALGTSETIKSEMVNVRSGYNRRKRSKLKSGLGTAASDTSETVDSKDDDYNRITKIRHVTNLFGVGHNSSRKFSQKTHSRKQEVYIKETPKTCGSVLEIQRGEIQCEDIPHEVRSLIMSNHVSNKETRKKQTMTSANCLDSYPSNLKESKYQNRVSLQPIQFGGQSSHLNTQSTSKCLGTSMSLTYEGQSQGFVPSVFTPP